MTVVSMTLTVEVDDDAWASFYGAGDAYDRAEAQSGRSLVADVEDYVASAVRDSAAGLGGAIRDVDVDGAEASR